MSMFMRRSLATTTTTTLLLGMLLGACASASAYTVSNATQFGAAPSYEVYDCEALVASFASHAGAVGHVRRLWGGG